jgi:hypothetical protein
MAYMIIPNKKSRVDLTGKRFGRWSIQEYSEEGLAHVASKVPNTDTSPIK